MLNIPRYPVVLREKRKFCQGIFELTFERSDGGPLTYLPGQFFSAHFKVDGEEKTRSYSGATPIDEVKATREFRFVISQVPQGLASGYFAGCQPGDGMEISGPFGNFILPPEDPRRYVLVATGTGVAPYRAMRPVLIKRLQRHPEMEIHMILGARRREELIYGDEFLALAETEPRFHFEVCYSRAMPDSPKAFEFPGHVQSRFAGLQVDPLDDLVYLCGHPDMVDDSARHFSARGFDRMRIKRERYEFSTL